MTAVTVQQPTRLLSGGSLSPSDFNDIAPGCASVDWGPDGTLLVDFGSDLTADQKLRVRIRCISADATEEALLNQAAQAYQNNLDFLAITTPTNAQSIAQVRTLTQQLNGVLRYITGL